MSGNRSFGDADGFLAQMAAGSRRRLARAQARLGESALLARARAQSRPVPLGLAPSGFDLLAEVKRRSPAAGKLAGPSLDLAGQSLRYRDGGALGLSVLTEPEAFQGSLADVTRVAAAVPQLPVMRKDFLVAPYQVIEARSAGASGVLLIVTMLEDAALSDMLCCARELGLFVLLECFDAGDVQRCRKLVDAAAGKGPAEGLLVGVNSRDLRTLQVDFQRFARLAPLLPRSIPWVAESGVETPAQAAQLATLGYRLVLVGTALMREPDPAGTIAAILAAGRGQAACASS